MQKTRIKKWRYYLKWTLWVLLVQIILVNISGAIYAYKFTHFYDHPPTVTSSQNILNKTWKLFVGPSFYKNVYEPEPSFPYESISLKTSDDILIDGWYSPTDSSKGCVILIHGYTTNKSYLVNEAAKFKQWGYTVLLIDLRAHGKSSGHTTSFGIKETEEVSKAFEFAQAKGHKRIILYGISLGAGICIKTVAENNQVRPFAIIADMPFGTLHNHFRSRARTLGFPTEPFAFLVTMWIGVERGFNGFRHNIALYAKNVKCPVLLEWGANDRFVMQSEMDNLYVNLASTNKKLVIYPDAGHYSFLQADQAEWEKQMQAFLASLTN